MIFSTKSKMKENKERKKSYPGFSPSLCLPAITHKSPTNPRRTAGEIGFRFNIIPCVLHLQQVWDGYWYSSMLKIRRGPQSTLCLFLPPASLPHCGQLTTFSRLDLNFRILNVSRWQKFQDTKEPRDQLNCYSTGLIFSINTLHNI